MIVTNCSSVFVILLFCLCRIHDRKLCVLGICTLLEMGPQRPNLEEVVPKLLPSCLVVFEGLKRAYEARAEGDDDDSSENDDDEDDDGMLRTVRYPCF